MSVRKAVRKAVRKVLPKEFRQKLKEQFKIKTEADEEKTTRTKAKISSIKSETVAIFSDNLNVIFENEKFSENTKISIRKRGKVEQEIIGGNYSSSKIIIPIEIFLGELQKMEEKIERFDFFADFGNGHWIRLKSMLPKESNQFAYQNVSDDKVELIKIYTTLDGYYALAFNKFDEGLVLYEIDEELEILKLRNFSNKEDKELLTSHGKLLLNKNSKEDLSLSINEIINYKNQQIDELNFALLEAKTVIPLIGLTITLSSNLIQNLVKVQVVTEKFPVIEAIKQENKIILKTQNMIIGWNNSLSVVAKRYNKITTLSASVSENTITLENRNEDLIKDFASTLYICRNLEEDTSVLSKLVINTPNEESDILIAQLEDDKFNFLQKNGNFDCLFDNEDSKTLLLSNPAFEVTAVYLRYIERPVFKKIEINKIGDYHIESESLKNKEFLKNFIGLHIVYQVSDKFYYTYKKISDLIVQDELEAL